MLEGVGISRVSAELNEALVRDLGVESRIATPSELNRIADGLSESPSDGLKNNACEDKLVEAGRDNQAAEVSDHGAFTSEFCEHIDLAESEKMTTSQASDALKGEPMENLGSPMGEDRFDEYRRDVEKGEATEKPRIVQNKSDGCRREEETISNLQAKYPDEEGFRILRERDLLDNHGMPVKDPTPPEGKQPEGRRIDIVVVDKDGQVLESVEVTSLDAPKAEQLAKEQRIRDVGGTHVRDPDSGQLYNVSGVETRVERRS